MAILKKGSSGSDVKQVQTLLNKNGAKPKLKVDGIFGPNTEAATLEFQKRLKLSRDKQIGPITMATLKYGKPLPEMTVGNFEKRREIVGTVWKHNKSVIVNFGKINIEIDALSSVTSKEIPKAHALFKENIKHWGKVNDLYESGIKKQAKFEGLRLTNPAAAEKLVAECEALKKQEFAIGKAKISPNTQSYQASLKASRNEIISATKKMEDFLKDLEASANEMDKLLKKLM